jgi:quercetin dioxygenase-like cupin family protein
VSGCPSKNRSDNRSKSRLAATGLIGLFLVACGAGQPRPPYPAWIVVDELPDAFIAGLPGVRAKQLATDLRTQRASYRVLIPADWDFTTGASPGQSVEIFVLAGSIELGEFPLEAGGYAYIPSGMTGMQMKSDDGAAILYFLDQADDASVIRTPLITNSNLIDWKSEDIGVSVKELRADPGSGARTWLMRIDADAILPWQQSSRAVEGYLLSGGMSYSECVGEIIATEAYLPGGYFHRPPGAIHGGPASATAGSATWYLRVTGKDIVEVVDGCAAADGAPATF